MQFDKQTVVDIIRQEVGSEQAQQALRQLPEQVDHEQHAELLQQLGVNPDQLISRFLH